MPRLGLAYAITPKTIFRGGYGIYYEPIGITYVQVNQTGFHRSTDLVPNLIGLSMVEFWHGLRGLTARLDQRITADIRSTIEAIEVGPDAELEIAAV